MELVLLGLTALLAFANGANDNCKGVATLVGYGAASPRAALIWAAVTTALGAAVSFWLAGALISSFSGSALFVRAEVLGVMFFISVLAGAFGWVIFATFTGMPVSTTHAITGALTGAGLVAFGGEQIRWSVLGISVALPLALGPLLSVAVVWQVVRGIEFRAVTVSAYKGKQGPCLERNQAVIYRGPWKKVVDDDGHVLERGQRMAVCDKTYRLYQREPYREQFSFVDPREAVPVEAAEPFNCHGGAKRHPRATKGMYYQETTPVSECCGTDGCC